MIWQLAGVIPVDPRPFTLRQLLQMNEGAQRARWRHTSEVMALIANVNRDTKKRPRAFQAADFDPFTERDTDPAVFSKATAGDLRRALGK